MPERRIDRRTLLKGGLVAGGTLLGGSAMAAVAKEVAERSAPPHPHTYARRPLHTAPPTGTAAEQAPSTQPTQPGVGPRPAGPNILVVMVDQLRTPQWFTASPVLARMLPNISRLHREGVSFERHYTASNDCTPARAAMVTGLYTHQTGCMITGGSTLDPGFPTWGSMLREYGYATWWYGKWHLTHGDNKWTALQDQGALEPYGFEGGTYPSPDGGPGQGWRVDPLIADQFEEWFAEYGDSAQPWCTTVSFVNPHDIAWWHKWSDRIPAEASAPALVNGLPPNYETPAMLEAQRKPLLQLSLQQTAARSFGPVPFTGPHAVRKWEQFMDLYVKLQRNVDAHVGRVLRTLESNPRVAANTVVVFTSDHGEYGASHGLRGKGASAYEEAIRVPLIVKDPRGRLTRAVRRPRTQLTSSVDVAPLLLTIASGSREWRLQARYAHLARRADLAAILSNPRARGRDYVLHATDEIVTEFATEPYAADAPLHVLALRTANAKFATYSNWRPHDTAPEQEGQERELYDYRTPAGRMELANGAGTSPLEAPLVRLYERALREELRGPLPRHLSDAQGLGFENYFLTAKKAARGAAAARLRREETEHGPLSPFGEAGGGPRGGEAPGGGAGGGLHGGEAPGGGAGGGLRGGEAPGGGAGGGLRGGEAPGGGESGDGLRGGGPQHLPAGRKRPHRHV
ncbi:MAG TPA: sulfatase-like hydrolase/transferase [Solirubrobacteraceae bacterium]|jgi:arylsulfatase A-like enzyme|nr:sulfatase-like hydrolase/transferase [Solirubrobacteraceae bacterium]